MGHIFISYSHKDTEYAHALADHLQGLGFEVWIDERLDYGAQWPQELQTQLDTCSAFIVIMSPRSYESEWVQSELQRARRKLKPILPLILEGDEPWLSVESTQYYDVRGGTFPDAKFYSALKRIMSPTPAAQTLQKPEEAIQAKSRTDGSKRNLGAAAAGILLMALIAGAIFFVPLLTKPNPSTQPFQVTDTGGGEMVLVPAGEFTMGRKASDELTDCQKFIADCQLAWFTDEEPIGKVYVDAFYIDAYEVTNGLYKACEENGACDPPKNNSSNQQASYYGNPDFDNYPIIWVDWNMAKAYCEWRGARLPTEAEWEKAARGTDARPYPWGDTLDESFANFNYNVGDTTSVGSYESGKSPYGAYDMAGNVWEWVSSLHKPYPYSAKDGRESSSAGEDLRVIRGGSWGYVGVGVSTSYRYGAKPTDSNLDLGFRCARDANP